MKTAKAVFGILSITAMLAMELHAQSFLTDGLVAYYPFTGNANDESGNNNNGTNFGATLISDRFGFANRAYCFDGISNQIVVGSSTSLNPPSAITISSWIRTTNVSQSGILSKWDGGQANNSVQSYGLLIRNGHPLAHINADNGDDNLKEGTVFIVDGTWHQVVLTGNNTNRTMSFFVDGQLNSSFSISGNIIHSTSTHVTIGVNEPISNLHWFRGAIDDIRIYNRALSATEIQQLYAYESQPIVALKNDALNKVVQPSFSNLLLGTNYQLQVSTDLSMWTNNGSPFSPTNTIMDYPQYFDVENWNSLYFRLQMAP